VASVIDQAVIREQFPLLKRELHGKPIVYLDSAASSLQPRRVIDAMSHYYANSHANVHRGVYGTAEEATGLYEGARHAVGALIGAKHPAQEIIFTKNATESINLFVSSWGGANLGPDDAVVVSIMEHHANIVPWLVLKERIGFDLRWIQVDDQGELILDNLDELLSGAKVLSITAMSNVLGTINPISELAAAAHRHGAIIHVDGCQSVPHLSVDVAALDIDLMSFSAHKMLGPTGIGVLWARRELITAMPPFLAGGGMILDVRTDGFTPADGPARFEAGTPPIAEAVGLAEAARCLREIGLDEVRAHEQALTAYALDSLFDAFGDTLRVHGPRDATRRGGVISFTLGDIHAHDIAQMLDAHAVCVRPGHHCAKPLMRQLGVPATARASFGIYNTMADVDVLVEGLHDATKLFA
jgi:cysteine desulfurase/selenocysteine lyase